MAVFLLGVGAACCLGLGFVLQQRAAARAPRTDILSFRLLLDLIRMPDWLLGVAFMVAGQVLSAIALTRGEISLVEPLTATNLLFAMALSRWLTRQPLGWSGWGGVVLLALGVTSFIVAGQPHGGGNVASALRHWLVFGIVAGLALLVTLYAKGLQPSLEATYLALAAGLIYGLQDALTRICGSIADDDGVARLVVSWQPYAVLAIGITGILLVQSAFEAAPLRMSLPALTAAQPLAGIACGIGFLGDQIRVTPLALAFQAAGLAAVVAGVLLLGRHPAMPQGPAKREKPGATRVA
ncbi:putative integral membrane protein [Actinacidiphila reveromycinica]|uniref:Putative integral membrane protein n=1 Tax=Actinacidiphila reveromycinica TaxID=659352 RepID=A0A7U3VRZ9_9ACTN|nr:DMT family transporter [Streptomyces sp. SN-593]BBB01225.1 putative integral membrane protein [Streptomyces sp. SN-593]